MYPDWLRVSARVSSEICHEVDGAFDAGWAPVEHVGVNLRGDARAIVSTSRMIGETVPEPSNE